MISKQPTIDDIYNFDAYISTPGVREGLMQRATLNDPEFTLEDTDDGQAMYFNTPHGEQVFVGMPEQTMPGRQEGDVMLAAGPSGTVSDAGATIGPTPRNPVMGGVADFVRGVRDLANEYQIKQFVPLLGGMGVGDLLMGKSPEELEEWAYGNAPMRVPEMTSVPMIKTGRKEQLADTMFLGMDAVGLGKSAGVAARTTAKTLGPKAGEMVVKSMEKLGTPLQMNIVESNKLKSNGEFINRDEFTAYMKQPKQLQGFKSSGINKPFDEQKYKHVEFVEVKLDDGGTFYDAIRGLNKTHAISRAFGNWSSADQIRTLSREQAQKVDPNLVKEVDSVMVAKEKK